MSKTTGPHVVVVNELGIDEMFVSVLGVFSNRTKAIKAIRGELDKRLRKMFNNSKDAYYDPKSPDSKFPDGREDWYGFFYRDKDSDEYSEFDFIISKPISVK